MLRRALGAVVLAGALVSVSACSAAQNGSNSGGQDGGGTFTLGVPIPIPSANPYATNTGAGVMAFLNYLAYDPLVNQDADGTFQTGLAATWSTTTSGATFQLRDDVTCSDGSKLTAGQVATDLNYIADPKNQYPMLGLYTPTVPYTAAGNDATGTVTVKTEEPFPFLLETLGNIPIVCAQGMQDPSMLTHGSAGTGPFVLQSANQTSYTYVVREGYSWGPDGASTSAPGTPAKVVLKIVMDPTTAANQLLAGQLSAMKISGPDAKRLIDQGMSYTQAPIQASTLSFNELPSQATSDVRVRQALAAAMDFDQLVQVQGQIDGTPATRSTGLRAGSPLPCAGAEASAALPASGTADANRLLDEAGWAIHGTIREKDGKPLEVTIAYADERDGPLAELIQQQWSAVGATVSLNLLSKAQISSYLQGVVNFSAIISATAFNLPSQMQGSYSGARPPDGPNILGVTNPTYDRLASQALSTSGSQGCALWVQAENSLLQRADVVPIADGSATLFLSGSAKAKMSTIRQPVPTSLRLGK